ncbi:MAG: methyltransferase domain-containing protein [Helicobacteraceae bacterium]|jgi:SAM-dependent methyltransferase|nr:methyltransferase domain-containing protein [Helicobacteraceae bacterium]
MRGELDLYAVFEPMIPFKKEIAALHGLFESKITASSAKSALDIGCGRGLFLARLRAAGVSAKGIDLSGAMVEAAKSEGLNAERIDLEDETGFYDALSAIFDVINYLKSEELNGFFRAARDRLNPNGAFIFDVNSPFGFKIASGDLILEEADRFAAIRSSFEGGELISRFTLFERKKEGDYKRTDWQITQYYHGLGAIKRALKQAGFGDVKTEEIRLYGEAKADKTLFVAKR